MVWICDECKKDQHKKCQSRFSCDCKCNVNGATDGLQKGVAIGGGILSAVGGLALTVCTGGLGAVLIGGAMLGAGISSAFHGTEKLIKDERINGKSYVADVAFGAVTGVATGGMGAAGETIATNVVKQGAKEVAKVGAKKLAVRAATGVVTGVATKAIDEVKQCSTTAKKWSDYGKSFDQNGKENGTATAWVTGGLVGGLGGASSHVSSNLTKQVTDGVAKSVTRIVVSGTTAALGDATVQGTNIAVGNQDHYDIARTVTSATTSTIMAAAQEGTKNTIYRINGGKRNMLVDEPNKTRMKKLPEQDRQAAMDGLEKVKKIPQETLNDGRKTAKIRTDLSEIHNAQEAKIQNNEAKMKRVRDFQQAAKIEKDVNKAKEYSQQYRHLKAMRTQAGKDLTLTEQKIGQHPPKLMDEQNTHFLHKQKFGQVAFDINQPDPTIRGQNRIILDYTTENNGHGIFLYSDHAAAHDYKNTQNFGKGSCYKNYTRHTNVLKATNEEVNNFMCNNALKDKEEKEEN